MPTRGTPTGGGWPRSWRREPWTRAPSCARGAEVTGVDDGAVALATGERLIADAVVLCTGRWTGSLSGVAMLDAASAARCPSGCS